MELSRLTTFRIGGTPDRYFRPSDEAELTDAVRSCSGAIEWRVLGGGSNVLVPDGVLHFAVIHVHGPGLAELSRLGRSGVRVGAGTPVSRLLAFCRDEGLGGLEFLAGLPGTVGGALAGNAGAWGCQVCDLVESVRIVRPDGSAATVPRQELEARYRHARLGSAVIAEAAFVLRPTSRELIALRMADYGRRRAERQPLAAASAGCVFKNPEGAAAGKLLDLCGLKGRRAGDAEVSRHHANFIINGGRATADDVLRLIELMRREVVRRFDVELELEVRHWSAPLRVA